MAKGEDITTKFKVDISDLKKGISEANRQIKLANAEFKAASAGMDDWSKSSAGITAKLKQLESVLTAQNSKLKNYKDQLKAIEDTEKKNGQRADELKTKLQQLASQGVSKTSAEYKKYEKALNDVEKEQLANKKAADDLKVTILNQEGAVNSTKKEMASYEGTLKDVEKAEKAAAKNGTTVEQELKKIEEQADKTDSKVGKLAKGLSKALVAGVAAVGAGVVAMTKSAITAYADYEQLVGGVDTLFKNSSSKVQKYAADAYKKQGMSANQYMETVTSFSASLLQSLGGDTEKAADVADMALTDMADNANKMGTSMDMIQNAYQGFAKQNYTMLDNLKLGYGGTKTEMERLLADATKISGVKYDISNLNDVYQAIHVIQGELGITGTTAKEAATTIQGSASAMKSAWSNLLTGLADDNANMEELIKNFIDSVGTFASNLIPRIQEVLSTILQLVIENLPQIASAITSWMGSLVDNIISALPPGLQEIASAIKDGLVNAFQGLIDIASGVIEKLSEMGKWLNEHKTAAGLLAGAIGTLTAAIVAYNIQQAIMNAGGIKAIASMAAQKLATIALTGVTTIATAATTAFGAAMAFLTSPVTLVVVAIAALVAGIVLLVKNWDKVKEAGAKCWEGIKNAWNAAGEWFNTNVIQPIKDFFTGLWEGISNVFSNIKEWFSEKFTAAKEAITSIFSTVAQWFSDNVVEPIKNFFSPLIDFYTTLFNVIKELAQGCWNAIVAIWSVVSDWFNTNIIIPVKDFFTALWDDIKNAAQSAWDFIVSVWTVVSTWFNENVITPVKEFFTSLWNGITEAASAAWNTIKEVWNVVSSWFNNTVIKPVSNFFTGMWDKLKSGASDAWNGIKNVFSNVTNWFKNQFTKAWTAVKNVFSTGGKIFNGIKEGITSAFKNVVNAIIRGINKVIAVPFNAINNMLDKIRNVSIAGIKPFANLISRFNVPQIPLLQKGGVLKKGQVGLLEGNGSEAVVPLEKNKLWIKRVADDMRNELQGGLASTSNLATNNVNNFTQIINAPKTPSRIELYRDARNLLNYTKGRA